MGLRGRKPIPTNVKKLQGTYRKDRDVGKDFNLPAAQDIPKPPTYFRKRARDVWHKVIFELEKLNLLTNLDFELLAAFCYQVQIMEVAARDINKNGMFMESTNKQGATYRYKNPAVSIYNEAVTQVNKLAQQFGLSPSARTRIKVPDPKPEINPMDLI